MPNTGKPSRDCHLCRRRRVKCDLQRPQCARCIKYGVACPGYRDQQDLVFRHASAFTIERRQAKRQPRPGPQQSVLITAQDVHDHDQQEKGKDEIRDDYASDHLPLCRSLAEHWQTRSVPMLLNIYDIGFIHSVFAAYGPDGPLAWAAHLFSRTWVVNVRNPTSISAGSRRDAQRELGECLGKTLRAVRALLGTEEGKARDDVLATVWILAGYELLVGTQSASMRNGRNTWHLHTHGLYSILKFRGPGQLYKTGGRMSFWPCLFMIQTEALVTGTHCPPETTGWLDVIQDSLIPGEGLALAIARFVQSVSAAQHETLEILYRRNHRAAAAALPRLLAGMASAQRELLAAHAAYKERHESDLSLVNLARSACVKGFHILHLLINFVTHRPGTVLGLGLGLGLDLDLDLELGSGSGPGGGKKQASERTGERMAELLLARAWCLAQVRKAADQILESVPHALSLSTWADYHGFVDDDDDDDDDHLDHYDKRTRRRKKRQSQNPEGNASHKVVFDGLKLMWPLIAVYTIPTTGHERRLKARAVLDFVGRELGVRQALGVREVINLQEGEETLPPEAESPLFEDPALLAGCDWGGLE